MARQLPQGSWVWVDGRPVPGESARVSVYDRGLLYGDSVYEVTRTVAGRPLWLGAHLRRMANSALGLELSLPPLAQVESAVAETLAAAGFAEAYLRIVVTRGAGELSLDPAAADEPNLLVYVRPLHLPAETCYRDGVALLMAGQRRNAPGHVPASIKSGNYLSSVLASAAAHRAGAYEALLTDLDGHVTEGASSNLFWVRGAELHTAPLSAGLLAGVTRAAVLALAQETASAGQPALVNKDAPVRLPGGVSEALVRAEELFKADEVLLTSSVRGVVPVVRLLDRTDAATQRADLMRQIGDGRPGPVTRWLMAAYAARIQVAGWAPPWSAGAGGAGR